ncbi:unnamed protein product [Didymodactylos carnosus]|uniref:Uncharacterized protein n=1 Tax=Didymodactylos carnosus TaxID=1234261 RepID=A0A814VYT0_9BILA|nr:unnamed protein product [Didymodactylos carnosus]CAF1222331.1 unnamed protein product [Didymodactylos carnosus]CAF3958165.1 unnamed protein product [Didymodactylos carnosus]CAF4030350.1 unnamed protein product [Didymodactylos carnosus]
MSLCQVGGPIHMGGCGGNPVTCRARNVVHYVSFPHPFDFTPNVVVSLSGIDTWYHEFKNIQYFHYLVDFINYLIYKYYHRIKRMDALETTIETFLIKNQNDKMMLRLYENFLYA